MKRSRSKRLNLAILMTPVKTINTQEATSVTESKQSEVKKEERKLVDREYVS